MKLVTTIKALRKELIRLRACGRTVGFVPTMGYFHAGHVSLMERSVKDHHATVVSLFVNPIQFGPGEDLGRYPRDLVRDRKMAQAAGVELFFVPSGAEMYPAGFLTHISVSRLGDSLCGASRPGHFSGVATVVGKLLNIVQPDAMYLGQKDAQQVEIISRMMRDLDFSTCLKVCPTVREKDGLAMSSRNAYLSPSERASAPSIYRALCHARAMIAAGERRAARINSVIKKLISDGAGASIEYVSCVTLHDLRFTRRIQGRVLIAVAARFGTTRLIDNIIVTT